MQNNMAKKKEINEELTQEEVVVNVVVEEVKAEEVINPHQIGHTTRAYRG
jgi:hypothetical protein